MILSGTPTAVPTIVVTKAAKPTLNNVEVKNPPLVLLNNKITTIEIICPFVAHLETDGISSTVERLVST
jgi:hypothetical protein